MDLQPLFLCVVTLIVYMVNPMTIGEEIKQDHFKSEYSKAIINIFYTSSWLDQRFAQVLKQFEITTPQFNILRILRGQHPHPSTINLLIERMLDKSSNASRIVDRLEKKGLVERIQCKNDRRAVDVFISQSGLKLLSQLDQELDSFENASRRLSEEESKTLSQLLDKLRNG